MNLTPTKSFGSVCSLTFLGQGQGLITLPLRGKKQPFWVRVLLSTFLGQGQEITLPLQGQETTFLQIRVLTFLGQGHTEDNLTPPRANGPPQELEGGARSAPYF